MEAAKNKEPGPNSLPSHCRGTVPAPLLYRFAVRSTTPIGASEIGVEGKPDSTESVKHSVTVGRVVQYLAGFLERSRIRTGRLLPEWEEEAGPLGVPPRGSANASLGVFDKLTLCTLSVELSLSNTRSAALQLSVGVAEVFAGVPSWANGEGKEGLKLLLTSEAFSS